MSSSVPDLAVAEITMCRRPAGIGGKQRVAGVARGQHGTEDAARLGEAGTADHAIDGPTGEACQPQVGHLDHAGAVTEQVGGLDVAVNHVPRVDVLQPAGRLQGAIDGLDTDGIFR